MTAMRWQCTKAGCYLQRRTDPVLLDGCFPDGVSTTDIDATCELNRHFLHVEFKRPGVDVPIGQRRYFREFKLLAPERITIVVVHALEQHVEGWRLVQADGSLGALRRGDVDGLRTHVKGWSSRVAPERPVSTLPLQRPAS